MKKFFSLLFLVAFAISFCNFTKAQDSEDSFDIKLSTKINKVNINEVFQVNLSTNQKVFKIEKDFLSLTGSGLINLKKVDDQNFLIDLKVFATATQVSVSVRPEKIYLENNISNKEKSNTINIPVNTPTYFAKLFGLSKSAPISKKPENSTNNSPSIFGSLGSLVGLLTGSSFGKGNFANKQQTPPQSSGQSEYAQTPPQTTTEQSGNTKSQTTTGSENPKPTKTATPGNSDIANSTNEGEIVFVECGTVKDTQNALVGRLLGSRRFDKHNTLSKGNSHSYLLNGNNYCFQSDDSYALAFVSTDQKSGASGNYKFVLFARRINIPDSITGKCAIVSNNQVAKPAEAVGYLSDKCSGILKKTYTDSLDTVGPVYVLKDGIDLVNQ